MPKDSFFYPLSGNMILAANRGSYTGFLLFLVRLRSTTVREYKGSAPSLWGVHKPLQKGAVSAPAEDPYGEQQEKYTLLGINPGLLSGFSVCPNGYAAPKITAGMKKDASTSCREGHLFFTVIITRWYLVSDGVPLSVASRIR